MSGPPCIARPLAGRIIAQHSAKGSGILTLTRSKLRRLFCFDEGWLTFAASNVIEEQPGEALVRRGLLSPSDLEAAHREAEREQKKLSALLLEHGIVSEADLRDVMEEQVRTLLSSCLEWTDGEQRFDIGKPRLPGEITVRLSAVELILSHAREHPASLDVLRTRIGPPDTAIELADGHDGVLDGLQLDALGSYLLKSSERCPSLGELLAETPADEEATLRRLYGMLLIRVLRPAGSVDDDAVRTKTERPPDREEVLARLAKADRADHYMLLGVERNADRSRIREAYYYLARRMHPDRYRTGELSDLLARMERFFAQVTEAYNTLIDPERRTQYDEVLTEGTPSAPTSQTDSAHLARQNYLRGKELAERRRHAEALKFLENAVKLDPTRAEYYLELGLLQSGNPRLRVDAERNLIKVTELEPTSTEAYMALGDLYQRANHLEEAARMYREVLRWEPSNVEAARLLREVGADNRGGFFGG